MSRQCQLSCAPECQINTSTVRAASQMAPLALAQEAQEAISALHHSDLLKTAARSAFENLRRRAQSAPPGAQLSEPDIGLPEPLLVCAHWRVGDWSFPLSPEMLVSSVRGAVEVYLGGEPGAVAEDAAARGGGVARQWAVVLASDATGMTWCGCGGGGGCVAALMHRPDGPSATLMLLALLSCPACLQGRFTSCMQLHCARTHAPNHALPPTNRQRHTPHSTQNRTPTRNVLRTRTHTHANTHTNAQTNTHTCPPLPPPTTTHDWQTKSGQP